MKSIVNDNSTIRIPISEYKKNVNSLEELQIKIKTTKNSVFISPNTSKTWKNVGENIYLQSQSIGYNPSSQSFENFCKLNLYNNYADCTMGLIGI